MVVATVDCEAVVTEVANEVAVSKTDAKEKKVLDTV